MDDKLMMILSKIKNKIWIEYFTNALKNKNKIELNNLIIISNELSDDEKQKLKKVINEL